MGFQKHRAPQLFFDRLQFHGVQTSTAPGTLAPQGIYALATTSTGAPAVFSVGAGSKRGGDLLVVAAHTIASSSVGPVKVKLPAGATFDGVNDVVVLSTQGAGALLLSLSSARWMLPAAFGATLSTST